MDKYINYKGEIFPHNQPIIRAGNRNFQYGDGLFETMRVSNGSILFESNHLSRLFSGIEALSLNIPATFNNNFLINAIRDLCNRNGRANARVRLTVFRDDQIETVAGPDQLSFLIETRDLQDSYVFSDNEFKVDVFPHMRKVADSVSFYKTCNYLPYALAGVYARQNNLNDCLVLNSEGNICDSSIANIFWVQGQDIFTPPLSEGCISGIMRMHLINKMRETGYVIRELPLSLDILPAANEVFLTNVIRGILPVSNFRGTSYESKISHRLFTQFVLPLC